MKRLIFVLLFLTAAAAAYLAGRTPAQQPSKTVVASTKVGVVNYAVLFNGYDKVKVIRDELDKRIDPVRKKKEELQKMAAEWAEILKNPTGKLSDKNIDKGRRIIIDCQRQIEDLETNFKKEIGKRLEDSMAELWLEINGKVREHANEHGFQLILGYGEPEAALPPSVKFQHTMRVVDAGGLTMAYAAGAIDVSAAVLNGLNSSYRASQPVKNDSPDEDD